MNKLNGFSKLTKIEQEKISAAGGGIGVFNSIVNSIVKLGGFSGISSLFGMFTNFAQRQSLVDKVMNLDKVELEFGKDGQFKVKWDETHKLPGSHSSIIF